MEMKFCRCEKCGKFIGMIKESKCPTYCCDVPMVDVFPGVTEAAVEKHVPVITTKPNNFVEVTVGSVIHPMEEKHYIEWIALETDQGIHIKTLDPGQEPKADFLVVDGNGVHKAYAYCNLHGLWSSN